MLHFYLAGINNQNFLMRDKETGTWWQQITGKAIYGPLKGASLDSGFKRRIDFRRVEVGVARTAKFSLRSRST